MDRLYSVEEIMDRYRCGVRTARKYMGEMGAIKTKPMLVTETAILKWEEKKQERAEDQQPEPRRRKPKSTMSIVPVPPKPGQYISRVRPKNIKSAL